MTRNLTCIVCPLGCALGAEIENGEVINITGNTCPKGAKYAKDECTNPVRTITTTVVDKNRNPIPVKTNRPVPKGKIFECMKEINSVVVENDVVIGDVVLENVANTGSDIIATVKANI